MASVAAGVTVAIDWGGVKVGTCDIRHAGSPSDPDAQDGYAENELPQPQPPVLFGFLNVKPEPCIDET